MEILVLVKVCLAIGSDNRQLRSWNNVKRHKTQDTVPFCSNSIVEDRTQTNTSLFQQFLFKVGHVSKRVTKIAKMGVKSSCSWVLSDSSRSLRFQEKHCVLDKSAGSFQVPHCVRSPVRKYPLLFFFSGRHHISVVVSRMHANPLTTFTRTDTSVCQSTERVQE